MPTYEYACRECEEHIEVVQKFTDDALTTCPSCGGPLRKVFGSVGIAFKGSGFYKTDSRNGSSAKASSKSSAPSTDGSSTSSDSSTSGGSTDKTEKKADSPKPAAASTSGSAAAS